MPHSPEAHITSQHQTGLSTHASATEDSLGVRCKAAPAEVLLDSSRPNSHDEEQTELPTKPIASMEDTGAAGYVQVMDSLSHAREPEHVAAASEHPKVTAAVSDATTVTGDQDRGYAAAVTDDVHSLIGTSTPQKCSYDPPALLTPGTAPEKGTVVPSVSDTQAVANTTPQSLQSPVQHAEPLDVKPDGELSNGSIRPRTTRQVACAARTILSLSRGDGTSNDPARPCVDRAVTHRSRRATDNGVMPPKTPAKAKEISSLAALLAGGVAGQCEPSAAVAIAEGRQQNPSGTGPNPHSEHNIGLCGAEAARREHITAAQSCENITPVRDEQLQASTGRKRRSQALKPAEEWPIRERSATFPAAERQESSRAAKFSCAGQQRDHDGEMHRTVGAASGGVPSTNCAAPLGQEVSQAPARLRRSRPAHTVPSSAAPDDATLDRPPRHGNYRSPYEQHDIVAGKLLAPRPQRSHPHAVPQQGPRKSSSSSQQHNGQHRDGPQDPHIRAFDRNQEQRISSKRSHPEDLAPGGCGVDVGGKHGGQVSMDMGMEWPTVGAVHPATRSGLHDHEMEEIDAGSGDEPHRKIGKSSRSDKYRQFSNLKGILVYSKEMFHKCSQVVTGLKHDLMEKETEVSLLTSEVQSLRSVVRLAQDMFKIIDECDNTNYRGQFDSNVASCLGR